jgi:hypothetical protein
MDPVQFQFGQSLKGAPSALQVRPTSCECGLPPSATSECDSA